MNEIPITMPEKLASILVISLALIISACAGDPDPRPLTEAEKVTDILTAGTGTWTPATSGGVTVDGVDVTDDLFTEFTITFLEGTYTTTGTSPVWPSQDTWRFKDETASVIIRGLDEKEITITEISASQLKMTLEWSETTYGGRTNSLKGKHEFTLNK